MDTNIDSPLISVIMPVYNSELYVKEAIESILNQTYSNFEFLIIDDASTDNTVEIVKEYCDTRIQLSTKFENKGISDSLNYGISISEGKYIARMDGDDISLPERFEKQVAFMEANQKVVVCGTQFLIVGNQRGYKLPETNEKLKIQLLQDNSLVHPSVMMRANEFKNLAVWYDVEKEPAEDYDLWVRLLAHGEIANLPDILLQYRVHDQQISQLNILKQKKIAFDVKLNLFKYIDYNLIDNEKRVLQKLAFLDSEINFQDVKYFFNFKKKLIKANVNDFFETVGFTNYIDSLEVDIVEKCFTKKKKFSPVLFFQYYRIIKKSRYKLDSLEQFKLFVKSLIFYTK